MNTKNPTLRSVSLPALVVALGLAACSSDATSLGPMPVTTASAKLRVVHAAPDAPAVDLYAAGSKSPIVQGLAFGDASGYLELAPGSYDIEIRAAGADPTSEPGYSTGAPALAANETVTAVASGLLGASDSEQAFRVLPLEEAFGSTASGTARVRIVHAGADAPTVAVDVGNDGSPEIAELARFADTGVEGVELPAGQALQVGLWAGAPAARVTAFTTPELPEGADLFVIATGLVGELPSQPNGFSLLAVGPDGALGFIRQNPSVYALHACPDAPAVDVYAGAAMLAGDLAFGQLSQPIQVPPGSYALDFYAAGTGPGTPVVSASTPPLAAGQRYLAIASGFLAPAMDQPPFQLIALTDGLATGDGMNARINVVHASPDAPRVDVSTVTAGQLDSPVIFSNLAFRDSASEDGVPVPPAALTVGVAATGSRAPVATFGLDTTAGLRAHVVAAGALAPALGQEAFRLLVVATSSSPWSVAEVLPMN
jgi:hypothetical protein